MNKLINAISLDFNLNIDANKFNKKLKLIFDFFKKYRKDFYIKQIYKYRSPMEQWNLFCRGRKKKSIENIVSKYRNINELYKKGILKIKNSSSRIVTYALPFQSLHNFNLACDILFIDKNNQVIHSADKEINSIKPYKLLNEICKKHELDTGLYFNKFVDAGHIFEPNICIKDLIHKNYILNDMKYYSLLEECFKSDILDTSKSISSK